MLNPRPSLAGYVTWQRIQRHFSGWDPWILDGLILHPRFGPLEVWRFLWENPSFWRGELLVLESVFCCKFISDFDLVICMVFVIAIIVLFVWLWTQRNTYPWNTSTAFLYSLLHTPFCLRCFNWFFHQLTTSHIGRYKIIALRQQHGCR